jgi:ferredoxin
VLAPDVFEADDYGHCVVLRDEVGDELAAQARAGADNCPERAITVT